MSDPQHARQPDPLSRCHQRLRGLAAASLLAGCGLALGAAPQPPLFDVHLHYTGVDAAALPPEEIIGILDDSGVTRVVVSGMPTSAVERLHAAAPARIIPFLSVYNAPGAKRDWMHDEDLPARVPELLDAAGGIYPEPSCWMRRAASIPNGGRFSRSRPTACSWGWIPSGPGVGSGSIR